MELRLLAVITAARHYGVELDRDDLRFPLGEVPQPAALVDWLRNSGLWARAVRLRWSELLALPISGPLVLMGRDGGAFLVVRADPARQLIWVRDPASATDHEPHALDLAAVTQLWEGSAILLRADRGGAYDNEPFSFLWLFRLIWQDKRLMKETFAASIMMTALSIVSMMLVMVVIDRVVTYRSYSTLALVSIVLGITVFYEAYFGFIRRQLTVALARRVDGRVNLWMFRRVLGLPIDFFERTQAGGVLYRLGHIGKVRDFITGQVLTTLLDLVTLAMLIPVLLWLSPTLTWMALLAAGVILLIIVAFIQPVRRLYHHYNEAEISKSTVLVESLRGIRTVKSLGLEPQRKEAWDHTTAAAGGWKLEMLDTLNWPQTLIIPFDFFLRSGVMMVGAYLTLDDPGTGGGLVAFMMLSSRLAQPLGGIARMLEQIEDVRAAVSMAASVLNQPREDTGAGAGLRPRFAGAISFTKVDFTYPGSKTTALDGVSFEIPAGSSVGLVGRSGSGKSTITRLLQGINREYEGYIKIDGNDLRSINLQHLRRSFGVVLQENFLFRGTIRDNIIGGRPGLTLTDVVRAARLAGAEEFIERMPQGYDTVVEEGSPNLSGGQRQRLAIARALITDPRILILDEATSALDPESEALVNANIARIAHGRTMLVVSHRLSSLTEMDQIIVLDRGRVMDVGPHRDLVERCPVYRQLWLQQTRYMDSQRAAAPAPVLAQGS
ncbi:peptidase domain-containing ABC transporter [Rhodovastum atsumiense]|uniref:Peptidase domain-containing ABC transporter n=1 Tax=Rhodovastum atsumiense TaxID=504468 RepID=A0A5M6ING5_9PROT|nr:peptidase domain-containing ABC transporter [Rhodovastum atsumiense]